MQTVCRLILVLLAIVTASCTTPETAQTGTGLKSGSTIAKSKTIVLIHGMFLTPISWAKWKEYFEGQGYVVHAPAWPLHNETPAALRAKHPDPALGRLKLDDVLESYRLFIGSLKEKPILIGHSMGGLITQLLLQENLGVAGIAIDSAPPKGLISLKFSFLRSNWGVISPFQDENEPYLPDEAAFHYAFSNCVSETDGKRIYQDFAVPESRLVGRATTTDVAEINFDKKALPLLLIGGAEDHIIPASLNYANYLRYHDAPSLTEFKNFPGRCHWTVGQDGWEEVAGFVDEWIKRN